VHVGDHGRVVVARRAGALRRLADRWWPATLHAVVVSASRGCVEVLHRRELVSTTARPVWSIARTVLMGSAVTRVSLEPHPRFEGALDACVSLGEAEVHFAFPEGASSAAALLGALERTGAPAA